MSTPAHLSILLRAEGLAHQGRYGEAQRLCDEVLLSDAEDAAALNLKGFCLASQGRPDAALPCFKLARLHLPTDAGIRYNLGKALEETGDADSALAEYEESLRLDSGYASSRVARGMLRAMRGDGAGAFEDFDALVQGDPRDGRARMLRGGCHLAAGRQAEAKLDFEAALRLDESLKPQVEALISGTLELDS